MTITAMSPDGVALAFPDDIDPAVMQTAIKNYLAASSGSPAPPAPAASPQGNSLGQDLQGGAHDAMAGVGQTATALGGVASRNGYTALGSALNTGGQFLADHAPTAVPATPDEDVGASLKDPNASWGDVGHAVLHSAARALPGTAPLIAAGAVPYVGLPLAGLGAAAESLGPTAYQRAQNNGRAEPDTSDVLNSTPTAALNAGLGAAMGGRMVGGIENAIGRTAAKAGVEAATGAGMEAANEAGGSLGTDKGLQLDPATIAGAGLTQGALGAARGVPELAQVGIKSASDNVMSRLVDQPVSAEDAQSMKRVGDGYDAKLQAVQNTRGGDAKPTAVLNSMKSELVNGLMDDGRALSQARIINQDTFQDLKTLIDQAQRHNNSISTDPLDTSSVFNSLNNSGLNSDVLQPILDKIRDLNTLSTQSFLKNQTGPFQKLGNAASQIGAVGGAAMTGNIPGLIGAIAGHGIAGKMGGIAGKGVDNVLGTATPQILLQRLAAARYLKQAGLDAGTFNPPGVADTLRQVQAGMPQPGPAGIQATVAAPAPDPVAEAAARAKAWSAYQKATGTAPKVLAPDAAMEKAFPAPDTQAAQEYLAGVQLPGQSLDPLGKTPTEPAGMPFDPQAQAALDAQAVGIPAVAATQQAGIDALKNRILNRKAAAQTIDGLAQAKIDKAVKGNSVALAAADKLPTDDAHSDSVAGTAAMVTALQDAARVQARAESASPELSDRMAVGLPAGDLTGNVAGQAGFLKPRPAPPAPPTAAPGPPGPSSAPAVQLPAQAPQAAPAAPPAAPMAPPVLNPATLATQGRPWEQYVGKTLPAGTTRAQVATAVNAVHSPENAAFLHANMSGADPAMLQPIIEHLRAQQAGAPGSNGTVEIAMPRQWAAGKANAEAQVAQQAAEARAIGLPETADALKEVGLTKGQAAKAAIRDAHLATLVDASKRAQAAALFTKRIMQHGPK